MDAFSHVLWSGLIFHKQKPKNVFWSVIFGVGPDLFSLGIFIFISLLTKGTLAFDGTREHWDPTMPSYVGMLYSITHSFVIFVTAFLLVWFLRKKPFWPLLAWGIHIVVDIPVHTAEFFPTPFLFPLSSYEVDSISWNKAPLILTNYSVLAVGYLWLYVKKFGKKRGLRAIDWRGEDRKRKLLRK